jgi:hypothetical protein
VPGSALALRRRLIQLDEPLEDALAVALGNAGTVVDDREPLLVSDARGLELDRPARRVLRGVLDEVEQDALDLRSVGDDLSGSVRCADQPIGSDRGRGGRGDRRVEIRDLDGLALELHVGVFGGGDE